MTPRAPGASEPVSDQIRELLARRAQRLRAGPAGEEDDDVFWVAELRVGDERHALPLEILRAAVPLRSVTPVPLAPPHVVGILRYENRILTAYSLASLLGVQGWRADPAVLLIVDVGGERLAAFDTEVVPQPVPLPLSLVERARATAGTGPVEVLEPGAAPLHLVDPAALLQRSVER